jgi:hypothetical protein
MLEGELRKLGAELGQLSGRLTMAVDLLVRSGVTSLANEIAWNR